MRLSQKEHKEWKDKLNRIGLIPKYSEVYLFLVAVTFLLVFIFNKPFNASFLKQGPLVSIFIAIVIAFSIYYAFSDKKINPIMKFLILFFVIYANFVVAIRSFPYIEKNVSGWFLIFPMINLINSFLLLGFFRAGFIDHTSILDKNAKRHEIIIGFIFLLIVFIISNYILKNYWAITFSICLVYSSMLNKLVTKLFFKDKN